MVENRTGGAGVIAAEAVAKAPADGYTLFIGIHDQLPSCRMLAKLPYDAIKDFAPVAKSSTAANILVVHPTCRPSRCASSSPMPGPIPASSPTPRRATAPPATSSGELFKQVAGVDLVHVPYRGAAPAVQDLVAGHVADVRHRAAGAAADHRRQGARARVASAQRLSGGARRADGGGSGLPRLEGGAWFGLLAPAGTPRAVVDWLNGETRKAFAAPDVRERFLVQGMTLPLGTPEEFLHLHRGANGALQRGDPARRHQGVG